MRSRFVPLLAALALPLIAAAQSSLLNVSYDPTRELYQDFNKAFIAQSKTPVAVRQSQRQQFDAPGNCRRQFGGSDRATRPRVDQSGRWRDAGDEFGHMLHELIQNRNGARCQVVQLLRPRDRSGFSADVDQPSPPVVRPVRAA